jgi:hypothetical protein
MNTQQSTPETFEPYVFQTRNTREGENKAHSKEGAQAMGFKGSIVGGAIVYGQMLQPLVKRYGETWLGRHWFSLRFKAPAYDDDYVTSHITPEASENGDISFHIRATNTDGQELIKMRTHIPEALPAVDPLAALEAKDWDGERQLGSWDRMELNTPFRPYRFQIAQSQQNTYCDLTEDTLPLYLEGDAPPLHPGLLMAQGSMAVQHQFEMPFWIHTGSTILTRQLIRIGDAVELRCTPIEKWKRGENDWVTFYQAYYLSSQTMQSAQPAVEVWKTSIVKIANRS